MKATSRIALSGLFFISILALVTTLSESKLRADDEVKLMRWLGIRKGVMERLRLGGSPILISPDGQRLALLTGVGGAPLALVDLESGRWLEYANDSYPDRVAGVWREYVREFGEGKDVDKPLPENLVVVRNSPFAKDGGSVPATIGLANKSLIGFSGTQGLFSIDSKFDKYQSLATVKNAQRVAASSNRFVITSTSARQFSCIDLHEGEFRLNVFSYHEPVKQVIVAHALPRAAFVYAEGMVLLDSEAEQKTKFMALDKSNIPKTNSALCFVNQDRWIAYVDVKESDELGDLKYETQIRYFDFKNETDDVVPPTMIDRSMYQSGNHITLQSTIDGRRLVVRKRDNEFDVYDFDEGQGRFDLVRELRKDDPRLENHRFHPQWQLLPSGDAIAIVGNHRKDSTEKPVDDAVLLNIGGFIDTREEARKRAASLVLTKEDKKGLQAYGSEPIPFELRRTDHPDELVQILEIDDRIEFEDSGLLSPEDRYLLLSEGRLLDTLTHDVIHLFDGTPERKPDSYYELQVAAAPHAGTVLSLGPRNGLLEWEWRDQSRRYPTATRIATQKELDEVDFPSSMRWSWVDQRGIVATEHGPDVVLWQLKPKLKQLQTLPNCSFPITASADGRDLLLTSQDGAFVLYRKENTGTYRGIDHVVKPNLYELSVADEPGKLFSFSNKVWSSVVWNPATRQFVEDSALQLDSATEKPKFSQNGRYVAYRAESTSNSRGASVAVMDRLTRRQGRIEIPGRIQDMAVANDGRHIIAHVDVNGSTPEQVWVLRYTLQNAVPSEIAATPEPHDGKRIDMSHSSGAVANWTPKHDADLGVSPNLQVSTRSTQLETDSPALPATTSARSGFTWKVVVSLLIGMLFVCFTCFMGMVVMLKIQKEARSSEESIVQCEIES